MHIILICCFRHTPQLGLTSFLSVRLPYIETVPRIWKDSFQHVSTYWRLATLDSYRRKLSARCAALASHTGKPSQPAGLLVWIVWRLPPIKKQSATKRHHALDLNR